MHTYKGVIQSGIGRGRELGFPTINLILEDKELSGIYAGWVEIDGKKHAAAIFADPTRELLEAHLLDFSGDVYGQTAAITLVDKIRESRKFDVDEDLMLAIRADVENARSRLCL